MFYFFLSLFSALLYWSAGFFLLFKIKHLKKVNQNDKTGISVVIPVRNEINRISPLLNSLKKQSHKNIEIIIVDDNSEDRTAEYCREKGFRVFSIKNKPDEWNGKSYACFKGAEKTKEKLILFLDADVEIKSDFIGILVSNYKKGIISVQPYHIPGSFTETLSFFFNVITASTAFSVFSDIKKNPVLFGPCILISRKDYFSFGGHSSVKGSPVDDISLALSASKSNIAIENFYGKDEISYRMYPEGISSIAEGWGKNTAFGSVHTDKSTVLLTVIWITGLINSILYFISSSLLFPGPATLFLAAFIYLLYSAQLYWISNKIGKFSMASIFIYPLHLIFFILVFFASLYNTFILGNVSWKGRQLHTKK